MSVDLLSCPFCGSDDVQSGGIWGVHCKTCGALGPDLSSRDEQVTWNTRAPDPAVAVLEAEVARWKEIDARLSDNKALEDFVYHIFYANPIENARANLVVAIQRYLRGEPLVTEDEAQRAELDAMSPDDRAAWWRKRNAEKLNAHNQ